MWIPYVLVVIEFIKKFILGNFTYHIQTLIFNKFNLSFGQNNTLELLTRLTSKMKITCSISSNNACACTYTQTHTHTYLYINIFVEINIVICVYMHIYSKII